MTNTYLNIPKHFIVSKGVLRERNQNIPRQAQPKKIDYQHTVRIIDQCKCSHQNEISILKANHRQEIEQKQRQISYLRQIIQMRTDQIEQSYMDYWQKSKSIHKQNQNELAVSICQSYLEESVLNQHGFQTKLFESSLFLPQQKISYLNYSLPETSEGVSQQILKVKRQINKTEDSLQHITKILRKEKKKYIYFNSNLQKTKQNTASRQGKELDETCHLKDELTLPQEHLQANSSFIMSVDQTQTDESQSISLFMEQLLNQHRILKKTLIELQQSTKQEMEDMKRYYSNQISQYIELLNKQKNKNKTLGLNYPSIFLEGDDKFDQIQAIELQSQSLFQDDVEAKQHFFSLD